MGGSMDKLILYPTDTCQWHALVNEAQAESRIILCENTESYLVFLLMRFSLGSQLLDSVIALDFLDSMQLTGKKQITKLKDVGDKSLLFCGLFPGIANKRGLSIDYFIHMGQSAYLSISELEVNEDSKLFSKLSHQFVNMKEILQTIQNRVFPGLY
jgi:hypothetical protein